MFEQSGPTHPLGELRVHHEVVYVFLGLGQLQLPGYHGNHQSRTACALREQREGGRKQSTESASKEEELVNCWLLAGKRAPMIEGSEDASTEGSDTMEGDEKRERGED